jgi:peptidyl-prolyl cis-trans isomerase C
MNVIVNGIAVDAAQWPSPQIAAVRELLRQRAVALGLLSPQSIADDVIDHAIERVLAQEVRVPTPTEMECRRYYEGHLQEFRSGDLVFARHILFQVSPGSSVDLIRAQAEQALAQVLAAPEEFEACALTLSNCPSGRQGGNLGQIGRSDTVPEFEQALFGDSWIGILPRLIKTRHGFHIVAVDRRIPGKTLPFEAICGRIAERLKTSVEARALRQYVSILAGAAELSGVDLKGATSPLLQ